MAQGMKYYDKPQNLMKNLITVLSNEKKHKYVHFFDQNTIGRSVFSKGNFGLLSTFS